MRVLQTLMEMRSYVAECGRAGKTIAFVPTMGALHEGHLELVRRGMNVADICIPYIFVNPKQFAPTEDFGSYPRTLEQDLIKLRSVNASAVYLPQADEIYPEGFSTSISVSGISESLEGEFRPHFFTGVATIVGKMLLQCMPNVVLFGEKDYQQLQVIKRMVTDLDLPIEIIAVPTVRDADGLALSSRNAYLDEGQRKIAIQLNKILRKMGEEILFGKNIEACEHAATAELFEAGFDKVDYITARNADTLYPPAQGERNLRLLAAAWLGKTRLIDNMDLGS